MAETQYILSDGTCWNDTETGDEIITSGGICINEQEAAEEPPPEEPPEDPPPEEPPEDPPADPYDIRLSLILKGLSCLRIRKQKRKVLK